MKKTLGFLSTLWVGMALAAGTPSKDLSKIVKANNDFGARLLRQVIQEGSNQGGNTLLSPISAHMALSMVLNGARGITESEIKSTLGVSDLTRKEINSLNQELLSLLSEKDDYALSLANSLWLDDYYRVVPAFRTEVSKYYEAEVASVDMGKADTAKQINDWVSSKTHGKIDKLVEFPLGSSFYLINATYFKGAWSSPFSPEATRPVPFVLKDGQKTTAQMMVDEKTLRYAKGNNYQAIELTYGLEGKTSMLIFLPNEGITTAEWLTNQRGNLEQAIQAVDNSNYERVDVRLPKFTFEYAQQLVPTLIAMGMPSAFSQAADFRDMSYDHTELNDARQKTFIKLDESGTEAAAATIIGGVTSVPEPAKIHFVADHPFVTAIRENATGTLLFLGTVEKPEAK